MSETSAIMLPPRAEVMSGPTASRANRQPHASPGIAWSRSLTIVVVKTSTRAVRGRTRSEPEPKSVWPTIRMSGAPNIASAVRTGDPVAAKVMVPSARDATAYAPMLMHWTRKRTRNSRMANKPVGRSSPDPP